MWLSQLQRSLSMLAMKQVVKLSKVGQNVFVDICFGVLHQPSLVLAVLLWPSGCLFFGMCRTSTQITLIPCINVAIMVRLKKDCGSKEV